MEAITEDAPFSPSASPPAPPLFSRHDFELPNEEFAGDATWQARPWHAGPPTAAESTSRWTGRKSLAYSSASGSLRMSTMTSEDVRLASTSAPPGTPAEAARGERALQDAAEQFSTLCNLALQEPSVGLNYVQTHIKSTSDEFQEVQNDTRAIASGVRERTEDMLVATVPHVQIIASDGTQVAMRGMSAELGRAAFYARSIAAGMHQRKGGAVPDLRPMPPSRLIKLLRSAEQFVALVRAMPPSEGGGKGKGGPAAARLLSSLTAMPRARGGGAEGEKGVAWAPASAFTEGLTRGIGAAELHVVVYDAEGDCITADHSSGNYALQLAARLSAQRGNSCVWLLQGGVKAIAGLKPLLLEPIWSRRAAELGFDMWLNVATEKDTHTLLRTSPRLYLGNERAARDLPQLARLKVTYVLNCGMDDAPAPALDAAAFSCLTLGLGNVEPDIERVRKGVAFVREARAAGGIVLVHCDTGLGRSAVVAIAYLLLCEDEATGGAAAGGGSMTLASALRRVLVASPGVLPGLCHCEALLQLERELRDGASSCALKDFDPTLLGDHLKVHWMAQRVLGGEGLAAEARSDESGNS